MELLQNSNVWFTFSFIIFAYIIFKFGVPAILGILDSRIEGIKKDLEESENLRVEAQEMLAQYQRKHRDAVKEADKILETAKENARAYKKKMEADLDAAMKRREAQLETRMNRMEQDAISEIRAYAAELSMTAARQIIVEKLDKKTGSALVESAISDIGNNLH